MSTSRSAAALADPADRIAEAVTRAGELVANVIQHTSDSGTMRAWDPEPDVPLRLEVADSELSCTARPTRHSLR